MKRYFIYIVASLLLAACSDNELSEGSSNTAAQGTTPLELGDVTTSGGTETLLSRSVVDQSALQRDSIGLFFVDGTGTGKYDSKDYNNKQYKYVNHKWYNATAADNILLSTTSGKLYGYYPYDKSSTDSTAIPLVASVNGKDYCYGKKENMDCLTGRITLPMTHAMSRIDITIDKSDGYNGSCTMTRLSLSGANISSHGTLNITKTAADYNITSQEENFTVLDLNILKGDTARCLVVPVKGSGTTAFKAAVSVYSTIDSHDVGVSIGELTLGQGVRYKVKLKMKGEQLIVDSVKLVKWNEVEKTAVIGNNDVTHPYVEIGGLKWSTMNLGATTATGPKDTSFGDYYAWGETEPYYSCINSDMSVTYGSKVIGNGNAAKKTAYDASNYYGTTAAPEWSTAPYELKDGVYILKKEYDAARANWGGEWRLPTLKDFQALYAACNTTAGFKTISANQATISQGIYFINTTVGANPLTIAGTKYNVNGILCVDASSVSLFFPIAGHIGFSVSTKVTAWDTNFQCRYWTSTLIEPQNDATKSHTRYADAYILSCTAPTTTFWVGDYGSRYNGFTIRPVCDK